MYATMSSAARGEWGWVAVWLAFSLVMLVTLRRTYRSARSDEIAAMLGGPLLAEMQRHPSSVITISRAEHDDGARWRMVVIRRDAE